jgi:filamentous hemagglutinin family protein
MRKNPGSKKPSFKLKPMCAAVLLAFSVDASANPNGGAVVNGSASFNTNGNTLTVTNTPGTIINWQGFSINSNEITHFAQQSASSAVLNRVITNNPSVILGTLSSNGRVFLVNPGGIVFGAGSTVDVAGMVATSLNLSDADFLAGRGNFTLTPGAQAVSNAGNITAQSGGEIYLIAPNVENSGVITAPNGEILLAAGYEVQLVNTLDPNLRVNITAPAGDATNIGQLVSSAGRLGLFGTVVKNTGAVSADSATMQGGKIVFRSSQRTEITGTASAQGVSGGEVKVLSDMQTGTVQISGTLDASAPQQGDGGFIDTSAAHLDINPTAHITAAAPNGKAGTWLIDPLNVTIAAAPAVEQGGAFATGTWTPTLSGSTILNTTIETALNAGTSVTVTTANAGFAEAGDITVAANITMTGAAPATLTLQAENDIIFNAGSVISSTNVTPTALNVVLNADSDGVNGGAIVMNSGSSIVSNGGNITLGGGVAGNGTGFANGNAVWANGITLTSATLNAGGGNIVLNGQGDLFGSSNMGVQLLGSSLITSGLGSISVTGTGGGVGTGTLNRGVRIEAASSLSSVDGAITITAQGARRSDGFQLIGGSTIQSGNGAITVNATSGTEDAASTTSVYGAWISGAGTLISSTGGNIQIAATSQGNVGTGNRGLSIDTGAQVTATGLANSITLSGTGGAGTNFNYGVIVTDAGSLVQSAGGNIGITGQGQGSGTDNYGVLIRTTANVSAAGTGGITLTGTGGNGTDHNTGISLQDTGTTVSTVDGAITLSGTSGAGTGTFNRGVNVQAATVAASGAGAITLIGQSAATATSSDGRGVEVRTGGTVQTNMGALTITGSSTVGTVALGTSFNEGIHLTDSSTPSGLGAGKVLSTSGAITLNGTAWGTGNNNFGIHVLHGATVDSTPGGTSAISLVSANAIGLHGAKLGLDSSGLLGVSGWNVWDGGAGTLNWSDGLNWSTDIAPLATDKVYFGKAVSLTVPGSISVADYSQVAGSLSVAGAFTLKTSGDISLAGGSILANSGGSTVSLLSNGNINLSSNANLSSALTGQPVNVVLNSDADGVGGGTIVMNSGASIISRNGNIVLGGGLTGNGFGYAGGVQGSEHGVALLGAILNAGVGNISIMGRGMDGTSNAYGVYISSASQLSTLGTGAISITGVGGAGLDSNRGVSVGLGSTITTLDGDLNIAGYGGLGTGSFNYGVTVEDAGTSVGSNRIGAVNIVAHGGSVGVAGGTNRGFLLRSGGGVFSNSGPISITGQGGYDGDGIRIGSTATDIATITSVIGNIHLIGASGDGFSLDRGVRLQGSGVKVSTAGTVRIVGTSISTGTGGGHQGVRIESGASVDNSAPLGLGSNPGSIHIVAQGGNGGEGFQLLTGASLLTDQGDIYIVGQSGTNQVGSTQLAGVAVSGSTISSMQGNVFVSGTSNAAFGSNNYGVVVTASNLSTLLAGNLTLIGKGGNGAGVGTSLNNGIGVIGNSTLSVADGMLTLLGAAGTVTGSTNRGVEIHGATTLVRATGTGSIYINGTLPGASAGGFDSGVVVGFGADVMTASGDIDIAGAGVNGGSNNYGVRVEDDGSTITSVSGNITLNGSGSVLGTNNYGVGITNANAAAATAMVNSGTGNLKITSVAGDVLLSGASATVGVVTTTSGRTTLSSQRHLIVDSALSLPVSPVSPLTLRVDNTGAGTGALQFPVAGAPFFGTGKITAGIVDLYYNPAVFGTQDNPNPLITATTLNQWMLVNNAINLQAINNNLAGSYALGNNLDMTGVVGFVPIGSTATPFIGQFDGLNREISNLTINTPALSQVGLFGVIGASGNVKNVGLTNVVINGDAAVGALAGLNHGTIFNTYVSGGTVTGGNGATGGLVGINQAGDGTAAIGITPGVAGSNASISNSYVEKVNVAVMAAVNPAVGGLVGINRGGLGGAGGNGAASQMGAAGGAGGAAIITNTYVSGGTVSGMGAFPVQFVGGLVGQNIGGNGGNGGAGNSVITAGGMGGAGGAATISSSYSSSGAVLGTAGQVGGLIGNNVSGTAGTAGAGLYGGGLGAAGIASASAVAWDGVTTGQVVNAIGAGNLNAVSSVGALSTQATYTGFDFTNTWWSVPGSTRPFLRTEWSSEINNAHQLQLVRMIPTADYTLVRNLDLTNALNVAPGSMWSASGFAPIGVYFFIPAEFFTGSFDGGNHTISNLSVSGGSDTGLFGLVSAGARISNLGLINPVISGSSNAAGLAGMASGALLSNVYVSGGTVTATGYPAGGLVSSSRDSVILNSHVSGVNLSGSSGTVGGLVGENLGGAILGSYVSGGSVSGSSYIGGLAGWNSGLIVGSSVLANSLVSGTSDTGGLVGTNAGLLVNSGLNTVTVTSTAAWGGFGGLAGRSGGFVINGKVQGLTLNATNATGQVGGAVGYNTGGLIGTQVISGTITLGAGTTMAGPMYGDNLGSVLNSHYNVDTVMVNALPQVQQGGLYTVQFTEWQNTGTLNISNYSGAGQSLAQTGNVHWVDTTLGSLQGMKDLLGFANDPRYSFKMSGSVNLAGLSNYSIPTLAGVFDGNDVVISGLNINTPWADNVGLFGEVASGAEVWNTYPSGGSVSGGVSVAALAALNLGLISNSGISGVTVAGQRYVGGMVEQNIGVIRNSYVQGGSVSALLAFGVTQAAVAAGGLAAENNGTISNSFVSSGTLKVADNQTNIGGLVGNNTGSILNSHVTDIRIQDLLAAPLTLADNVGGLVGKNAAQGMVVSSYVSGTSTAISGRNYVGGVVGKNLTAFGNPSNVSNIYFADGLVTGNNFVGGLAGSDGAFSGDGTTFGVTNSYVSSGTIQGNTNVGALNGNGLLLQPTNNHYDINSVSLFGFDTRANAYTGGTVVQRGGLYAVQFADWLAGGKTLNIANYSGTGQSLAWDSVSGNYVITTTQGLQDMLGFAEDPTLSFALGASLNVVSLPNYAIPLLGANLDGQGNTISGVNINLGWMDNVGLVGQLHGTVSNLGVITPTVNGSIGVGGLAAYNAGGRYAGTTLFAAGSIINSYVSGGTIVGYTQVGGLVGLGVGSSLIDASYASGGSVSGGLLVGGLVGDNGGSIQNNSYVLNVAVNGATDVGGLVGYNSGAISNAYVSGGSVGGAGASNVGGLIGSNVGGALTAVHTDSVAVSGGSNVGGLLGNSSNAILSGGYVLNANVAATGSQVGGLIGWNDKTQFFLGTPVINSSYVSGGTVTGRNYVGGLVGSSGTGTSIVGSYAENLSVSTTLSSRAIPVLYLGGLVAQNAGGITQSYVGATIIDAGTAFTDGTGYVGGIVGHNTGSIGASYVSGGSVNGQGAWDIGGVAGYNNGVISQVYVATAMTSAWGNAGLVGRNDLFGTVSNAVWDKTLTGDLSLTGVSINSNMTPPSAVAGLATADFTTLANFNSATVANGNVSPGFDFINTWRMYDGLSAPLLKNFLRPLTVSVGGSRIYDGTTNVASLATYTDGIYPVTPDATLLGTLLADTVSANVSITPYSVTPAGGLYSTSQHGYDISYVGGNVTITPAALTLLGVRANSGVKVYGSTYNFNATDFSVANGALLGADTIVGMTFSSAGAINTAGVGNYAITPSNAIFGVPGSEANYNITYLDGTLTVNPAPLAVTANVQTKIYGDADPALTYTSSGLLFSDVLTGSLGRTGGQNVGNYAINQGSLNNPNYAITFTGNTLSITPRSITVAATVASKVYGDADPNLFMVGGSGLAPWDTNASVFTGSLGHTGGENIGTYTITQGSLLANANYSVASFTGNNLLITPALLTVVANSQNKVLGTPDPLLTYMTYGLKLNDSAATTLSGQLDRDVGDTIGTYSINQGSLTLLSSNYTMTYVAGTFRILAPTVVQEITQTAVGSSPVNEEKDTKESNDLLAEAATTDDSGQSLATPLPVCQ